MRAAGCGRAFLDRLGGAIAVTAAATSTPPLLSHAPPPRLTLTPALHPTPPETPALRHCQQGKECMLFAGTALANGSAVCVVTSIGMSTEIGKIQAQIAEAAKVRQRARSRGGWGPAGRGWRSGVWVAVVVVVVGQVEGRGQGPEAMGSRRTHQAEGGARRPASGVRREVGWG